jgi:hypothetical protein
MRVLLTYLLLVIAISAHAQREERVFSSLYSKSDWVMAGTVVQAEELNLVFSHYTGYQLSPAAFASNRASDSLFYAYVANQRRQDSLKYVAADRKQQAEMKAAIKYARAHHKPPPVFEPVRPEIFQYVTEPMHLIKYTIVPLMVDMRNKNITDSIFKPLYTRDTITVLTYDARPYGRDTIVARKGRECVVYYRKPEFYSSPKFVGITTPELESYYSNNRIYWLDAERIEKAQWKQVLVQY